MSKNLKIINATKEFFKNSVGSDTWSAKEFGFSKNYPVSIILEARTGGSEGGSCYGTYTAQYDISDDEIKSDLANSLEYKILGFLESLDIKVNQDELKKKAYSTAENIFYKDIGEKSDGADYYGNYSTYKAYEVNVLYFLKNLVPHDMYQVIQGVASTIEKQRDFDYQTSQLEMQEQSIVNQLDLFETKRLEEKQGLDKELENLKISMMRVEQKIKDFDKVKSKENSKLVSSLNRLREERKQHNGDDVIFCTPKHENKKRGPRW